MRSLLLAISSMITVSLISCSDGRGEGDSQATVDNGAQAKPAQPTVSSPSEEPGLDPAVDSINLIDLGAVGDGLRDNTRELQNAVDNYARVHIPASKKGFRIDGSVFIRKPVIITGDNTEVLSAAKRLFVLQSNQVKIEQLVINHDREAKGTTFHFANNDLGMERIYLQDIEVHNAYHGLTDENQYPDNKIINLHLSNIIFWGGQHSQLQLRDAFAYLYLDKVTFDFTRDTQFELNFPVVDLKNNKGSFFTDVHVNANGVQPSVGVGVGFSISNSRAVWMTRTMADTIGGYGYIFNDVRYVYLTDSIASLNANGGFYFVNCRFLQASNLVAAGINGVSQYDPIPGAHGVIINDSDDMQFANLSSRNNTGYPVVIDGESTMVQGSNISFLNNGEDIVYGGGNFE